MGKKPVSYLGGAVLIGTAIGAVVGLLAAPLSGKEMRGMLRRRAIDAGKEIPDRLKDVPGALRDLPERGREALRELPARGREALRDLPERGREALRDLPERGREALSDLPERGRRTLSRLPAWARPRRRPDQPIDTTATEVRADAAAPQAEDVPARERGDA